VSKARKQFFFEKKNQKTFGPAGVANGVATARRTKFFCFFLVTKRSAYVALALLSLPLAAFTPAPTGPGPGPELGPVSKLPIPRFVSLRTNQVNFRAGPGFQYPVTWIYQRDGLPVEIIGEFDVWRQVLAPDGGTGWVHMATIRARRTFFITAPQAELRASPAQGAPPVAKLDQGVSGILISCDPTSQFCKASADNITGYLSRGDFWGAFPDEAVK
jgi:SH3-like domain-containing protein